MLYAQLHGKLRRDQENQEDLLTSNVFGALKHVPAGRGLVPFLRRVTGACAPQFLAALDSENVDVEYQFWPPLKSSEPDVLIRISSDRGARLLILVEAKLKFGKSSQTRPDDEPVGDQLAREWLDVVQLARAEQRRPFLVYLTADYSAPIDALAGSQDELRRKHGTEGALLWLSWREFSVVARVSGSMLLDDVARLLTERYALTSFDGITPRRARANWRFAGPAQGSTDSRTLCWIAGLPRALPWHFDCGNSAPWRSTAHNPWRWIR